MKLLNELADLNSLSTLLEDAEAAWEKAKGNLKDLAKELEHNGKEVESEDDSVDPEVLVHTLKTHLDKLKDDVPSLAKLVKMVMSLRKMRSWGAELQAKCLLSLTLLMIARGGAAVKALSKEVDVKKLKGMLRNNQVEVQLQLVLSKELRTDDQVDFEAKNDRFIFIAKPGFREHPKGSGNYKKTLDIENLYKIDQYQMHDQQALGMMKVRAAHQGEGSRVYTVTLPAGTMPDKANTDLPDWLVDLIDKHKETV